ncbi:MAG TPA: hypothetical protein VIF10_14390 [Methylobacter sp.]|jgi:hypothetical protein
MKFLFPLGQVVATPGAIDLLENNNLEISSLLTRHVSGDFGNLCREDLKANRDALVDGARIFSSYEINDDKDKIWIITESDRSATTLLLPEEY